MNDNMQLDVLTSPQLTLKFNIGNCLSTLDKNKYNPLCGNFLKPISIEELEFSEQTLEMCQASPLFV